MNALGLDALRAQHAESGMGLGWARQVHPRLFPGYLVRGRPGAPACFGGAPWWDARQAEAAVADLLQNADVRVLTLPEPRWANEFASRSPAKLDHRRYPDGAFSSTFRAACRSSNLSRLTLPVALAVVEQG